MSDTLTSNLARTQTYDFSKNEGRKGYKKTKLGWIPEEWDVKRIDKIARTKAGGTPSTKIKSYWINGTIPWMSSGELNLKIVNDVEGRITEEGLANSSANLIPPNSILVGLAGQGKTRGTAAINNIELCTNQSVAAIMPTNRNIYFKYLYYNIDSRYEELRRLSTGDGGRGGLNLRLINAIKIPIPKLPEQTAIATCLSTWDSAIATLTQLIEKKQQAKKGLMQQLLSGKKRLPGFVGEWVIHSLGEYFNERKECNYSNLSLLSIGENGVYPQQDSNKKDTSNNDKTKYKKICKGDIGYNTMRMWQGRSGLSSLEGIVSPAYTIVIPKGMANSLFFSYLFKTNFGMHKFYRNSQGLVSDTLNCKFKDFKKVKFELPATIKEQTAIAQVLQTADDELALLSEKLEKLKEQKKGLMQVLLTGRKRLEY